MRERTLIFLVAVLLGASAWGASGCGGSADVTTTGESIASTESTDAGTGAGTTPVTVDEQAQSLRIVFNGEISGELVYDCALVRKGVRTALATLGSQLAGRPIEYTEIDNTSDPLMAVEATRKLVETDADGDKESDPVDFICGPLSSSAVAGVTFFLAHRAEERERIPQCAVTALPSDNITTSGDLGFVPSGVYGSYGYYLGKFAGDVLKYKTANCIHYSDPAAEELQSGFAKGFAESGGTVASLTYVPPDTTEFSTYFAQMLPADCTMFWVRGEGAIPFVRQYGAAGLTGTLLVPVSSNYSEAQLKYLGALGLGLGIVSCDCYSPMLGNTLNTQFIAQYQRLYPGEYPTPEAFGGWQAVMLYAEGVKLVAEARAAGVKGEDDNLVDPSDPAAVIAAMSTVTMDTPSGLMTMSAYGSSYLPTRDLYILRSKDVGGGRIAWTPIKTYAQVRLGE
jgi:ABC-type branched-subunit amino acid transport system substrate-binding protein